MKFNGGEDDPRSPAGDVIREDRQEAYLGMRCRVCGSKILLSEVPNAIHVGPSVNLESRVAHRGCFRSNKPKSMWRFPVDIKQHRNIKI